MRAYLYVAMSILPLLQGCRTSDSPQAVATPSPLSGVFEAWETGDKDNAVRLLVSMEWSPDLTSGAPILMSEQEIMSLSQSERDRTTAEAIKLADASKELGRHAVSLGENAEGSDDVEGARAHYEAVLNFGQALSNPKGLFPLKSVGNAIVTMANEKLSTLD